MKTINRFILVITGCVLLQTKAFCDYDAIVAAIDLMRTQVLQGLTTSVNSINQQISGVFDGIFNATFKPDGSVDSPSVIDTKIGLYAKNFYSWFTTTDFSDLNFSTSNKDNMDAIRKLLSQEIGYNTQKNVLEKLKDSKALLSEPFETGSNNIDLSSLGLSSGSFTLYGSLDNSAPTADNAPNVNDLIGNDSYANDAEKNKAKLFISYILQSIPPVKSFYIPAKTFPMIYMYLPYASEDSPYKTVPILTVPSIGADGKMSSEYDRMVAYLNKESKFYQPYKLKVRTANVLRTLYTEGVRRAYQERVKDKDGKSLIEREKELAFAGLNKEYYEDLKKKSVADVNLETLKAINKLTYFVYKLHQDNERISLITATSGMQTSQGLGGGMMDDVSYVNPIGTLIENKCWDVTTSSPADIQSVCANPRVTKRAP